MQTRPPLSILLVEDDEVDVMLVERILSRSNLRYRLIHAANGLEALDRLRSEDLESPLLVLLDLNMPRMGGLEFLRELRADDALADTAVYVLTTSKRREDVVESRRLQVTGYLLKDECSANPQRFTQVLREFWSQNTGGEATHL